MSEPDWKQRAEEAERRLGDAEAELEAARSRLEDASATLARSERAHDLERSLAQAGALDVEAARLVVESSLLKDEPSERATAALRRQRPHLFRSPARPGSASAAAGDGGGGDLDELARRARETGDPRALAEYMRRRRERNT